MFRCFGPNGLGKIQSAVDKFLKPYKHYFQTVNGIEDVARVVAYFDKIAAGFTNKLFNVYPIIRSTRFESDFLKSDLNMEFQKWAKIFFGDVADSIVGMSQSVGNEEDFSVVREFLNHLTSPTGEEEFYEWVEENKMIE